MPSSCFFCLGFLLFFPLRIILTELQMGGVSLRGWIPVTETTYSFESEFPSFLKLRGHITAELRTVLLLHHTNYPSYNNGVFTIFFWVCLFRIRQWEAGSWPVLNVRKLRMIVRCQFSYQTLDFYLTINLQNVYCPGSNKTLKDLWGLSKRRAALGAFTKYFILVEANLRIQRVITYPYILR